MFKTARQVGKSRGCACRLLAYSTSRIFNLALRLIFELTAGYTSPIPPRVRLRADFVAAEFCAGGNVHIGGRKLKPCATPAVRPAAGVPRSAARRAGRQELDSLSG